MKNDGIFWGKVDFHMCANSLVSGLSMIQEEAHVSSRE